jgi:tetratricopeptide (TPR) repeat protein
MKYFIITAIVCFHSSFSYSQGSDISTRAESYFINGDLFQAEYIFKDVAKTSQGVVYSHAISRLVDIAEQNSDTALFKYVIDNSKDFKNIRSEARSSIIYKIAKMSFHEGDCDLSTKFIDSLDKETPYYFKGQYIKASCFVINKKHKNALLLFDKLSNYKSDYNTKDVVDLATIGKARVLVLLGRFNEALMSYQLIDAISPYYLRSLYEMGMLMISKKDYEKALYHLEAISLLDDRDWDKQKLSADYSEDISEFDFMKVKTIRGYIYMENNMYEEANKIFDEVLTEYSGIKKIFADEINKFKLSDDLTKVLSHPYKDGSPVSVDTNIAFALFNNDATYSRAFREWLTTKEKDYLRRSLSVYFALDKRVEAIISSKTRDKYTDQEIQFIALRNIMNRYLKSYIASTIKIINSRLDDIGLKAQLGKIDITWKTKEEQSKKIKNIQENKQKIIEDLDSKYKGRDD